MANNTAATAVKEAVANVVAEASEGVSIFARVQVVAVRLVYWLPVYRLWFKGE